MRFLGGLYNLYLSLANTDSNEYLESRVTYGQHESEPPLLMSARVLAYLFSYREGTKLLTNGVDQANPCFSCLTPSKDIKVAGFVGNVEAKQVRHQVRGGTSEITVFFYNRSQILSFCKELRGSKENWVKKVAFYFLSEDTLEKTTSLVKQRSNWNATITDKNTMYLNLDDTDILVESIELDIWDEFQNSLKSSHNQEELSAI